MAASQKLQLEVVSIDDVRALTEVWFAAFAAPDFPQLWPDTSEVRTWFTEANRDDMLKKPFQRYVKVVDTQSTNMQGHARIAGYAKWDLAMPNERGCRYPPWHADMNAQLCDGFFGAEENERRRVMGEQKHYYLDTVATHPDYQRQGAGFMLVKWGCELADQDGVAAYVDASKAGAPLYQKFGFVDKSESGVSGIASMVRARQEAVNQTGSS